MREYGFRDLLFCYLFYRRYKKSHSNLAGFHTGRYRALSRLFDIDLDVNPMKVWQKRNARRVPANATAKAAAGRDAPGAEDFFEASNRRIAWEILNDVVRSYEAIVNPFDGLLEAPRTVVAVYQKHRTVVGETNRQYRATIFAIIEDLARVVYGDRAETFSSDDLRALGFDDSTLPDPLEYL